METFLGIDYPTLWYLVVGLLFMTQGAIFLLLKTGGRLHARLSFLLKKGIVLFITSFAITSLYTLVFISGVTDKFKENPVFFILPLLAFLAVANVPRLVSKKKYGQALVFSSLTMAFLLMLVAFQLYQVLLPSTIDPIYSITIYNAASSQKIFRHHVNHRINWHTTFSWLFLVFI